MVGSAKEEDLRQSPPGGSRHSPYAALLTLRRLPCTMKTFSERVGCGVPQPQMWDQRPGLLACSVSGLTHATSQSLLT